MIYDRTAMQTLLVAAELNSWLDLLAPLYAGGHSVSFTSTIGNARQLMRRVHYDLLLIDLDLPQDDGVRLCAEVRQRYDDLVIIFLDCSEQVQRRVLGFETGADDIMGYPCDGEELLARAKARRLQRNESVMTSRPRVPDTL